MGTALSKHGTCLTVVSLTFSMLTQGRGGSGLVEKVQDKKGKVELGYEAIMSAQWPEKHMYLASVRQIESPLPEPGLPHSLHPSPPALYLLTFACFCLCSTQMAVLFLFLFFVFRWLLSRHAPVL